MNASSKSVARVWGIISDNVWQGVMFPSLYYAIMSFRNTISARMEQQSLFRRIAYATRRGNNKSQHEHKWSLILFEAFRAQSICHAQHKALAIQWRLVIYTPGLKCFNSFSVLWWGALEPFTDQTPSLWHNCEINPEDNVRLMNHRT